MLTVLSAFAQEQSYNVSEDCKWRIKKQFEQGILPMSLQRLYGYKRTDDGGFEIINDEAKVIRFIFSSYLSGMGLKRICDDLNEKKIPSPSGKHWNIKSLQYLLSNEKYCGDLLLQKTFTADYLTKKKVTNNGTVTQYFVENSHPSIISKAIFQLAQSEFKRRDNNGGVSIGGRELSGKIICGECGGIYGPKVWHSTDKYRRVIWQCNSKYKQKGNKTCSALHIKEETVKQAFVELYNGMVGDNDFISGLEQSFAESKKSDKITEALAKTEEQLLITTQKIQKLIATNAHSTMDQVEYGKSFDKLCEKRQGIEAEIKELKDEKFLRDTRLMYREDFIRQLKKHGKVILGFDIDLFNRIVEMVTINDNHTLAFAFRDGTKQDWQY